MFPHHRLFVNVIISNIRVYIWEPKLIRVKINHTLVQALRLCTGSLVNKGIRGIVLLLLTTTLEEIKVSESRPFCSLTPRKTQFSLYRGMGGPQGRSGQVRNISITPGFMQGPSSPYPAAISTTLPGPQTN